MTTTSNQHGGRRKRAGRKSEVPGEKVEKKTVTLHPMTQRKLRVIGDGNLSRGIRRAADIAYDKYQSTPD